MTFVRLYPYDPINNPKVQIFKSPNYSTGKAGTFGPGYYLEREIHEDHHIDGVTSIVVPEGLTMTIYRENNYSGKQRTIPGPFMISLKDHPDLEWRDWNDQIRSI